MTSRNTRGACFVDNRSGRVGLVQGWRGRCDVGTRRGHRSQTRILRGVGYQSLEKKLSACGADIVRVKGDSV